MADMTPQEAQRRLDDAFYQAFDSGYRVQPTRLNAEVASYDTVAYEAAQAIIRQRHPNTKFDFDEKLQVHRFDRLIRRQTERNR